METNLAVLIDFENIAAGTEKEGLGRFDVETLMQRMKDKGRILIARSYADWGRFSRFKQSLLSANITMMELTSHGMQDKNRADIALVVDALELAYTKHYVDTFVVVSGDSDFTPMVLKMRELNKRVIGVGTRKSTSRLLIQACDEFLFYDTIIHQPKKRATMRTGASEELAAAFVLVQEALDGLQRENPDPPHGSVVKTAVLRKSPDFSESDLGFASFARFLEAARDAGIVRLLRDQKSGGYRVDSAEADEADPAPAPVAAEKAASSGWRDEYLPTGATRFTEPLAEAGLDPLSAATRLAILESLVQVVEERDARRRKTTLQFVQDDVKKKLRRTHAELPPELLRGVLEALLRAGELIHRDGTAIRSGSAAFTLRKSAEELNDALVKLYLAQLREAAVDVSDTAALAELFYGQADRRREVETTLAWLQAEGWSPNPTEPAGSNDLDLDDLLTVGGPAARRDDALPEALPDDLDSLLESGAEPEPVVEAQDLPLDLDAVLEPVGSRMDLNEAGESAPAAEPRKRKRTRSRDGKDPKDEGPKDEATKDEATRDAAPKREPRKRAPRKPAAEDISDLDALLEPTPKG